MQFKYQYINQQNLGRESSLRQESMQSQKLVKENKGKNDQEAGKLWRVINHKASTEDQKSTQKSNVLTLKSQGYRRHLKSQESNKSQPDINQFLLHVHKKINTSQDCQIEESEIMEKFSLDWVQEEQKQKQASSKMMNQGSLRSGQEHRFLHEGSRTQRIGCPDLEVIKSVQNFEDFQQMMSMLNPKIFAKISNLIQQNEKLQSDCDNLRYIEKKAIVKIDLLKNEIDVLEKKNKAIQSQYTKLKTKLFHQQSSLSPNKSVHISHHQQTHQLDSIQKEFSEKNTSPKQTSIHQYYSPKAKSGFKFSDCLQKEINSNANLPQNSQLKQEIFTKKKNPPKLTPHDYNDIVFDIFRPTNSSRRTPKHN